MDPRVIELYTPEQCATFAINASERGRPDLAEEAQRRSFQLRAVELGAQTALENKIFEALCAYEAFLAEKNGRKTAAARTRQSIRNLEPVGAVEDLVNRSQPTDGFLWLCENGMHDLTFEAVVLDNIDDFSDEAVYSAMEKLEPFGI